MTAAGLLLTAEEYAVLPDDGRPTELVRGVVVPLEFSFPRHGEICAQVLHLVQRYLETYPYGRLVCNGSAVITQRHPDTLRGPDISFYSFARIPRGRLPDGYLSVAPDLIFEVRAPSDDWSELMRKAAEYLQAGAVLVCILDEETETASIHHSCQEHFTVASEEDLTLPEVLPDFCIPIRRFFE